MPQFKNGEVETIQRHMINPWSDRNIFYPGLISVSTLAVLQDDIIGENWVKGTSDVNVLLLTTYVYLLVSSTKKRSLLLKR